MNQTMISPYIFPGIVTDDTKLLDIICNRFDITIKQLLGAERTQDLVKPRMWYAYILRTFLRKEYKQIGKLIGGRNHSTIIYYMQQMDGFLEVSKEERKEFINFLSGINHKWSEKLTNKLNTK